MAASLGSFFFDYFRDAAGRVVGDDLFDPWMAFEEPGALREGHRM